jgi:uncharacterized protein (TIGR04255 family)
VNQQIELVQGVEARCWYVSGDDRNLVQVQRDRFLYNWRKGDSDVEYPRFEKSVRPQFEDNWSRFRDFLETEQLGAPVVVQCEVTYVNHIPRGEGWQSTGDWHRVFNALAPLRDMKFLPSPEAGRIAFNFLMPEQQGRLRVSINQAIRHTDGVDLIVLQLTARGRPKSSEAADIVNWLNLGREWVVRGFTDLTTQSMHKLWEREE